MNLRMYSVFDVKAAAYAQPFFLVNDAVAVRACVDVLKDANHQWSAHPGDYRLVFVGEFDDQIGLLLSLSNPIVVAELASLVAAREE